MEFHHSPHAFNIFTFFFLFLASQFTITFVLGYHSADYCRLVHAYRGGSNMISDEIFESVISPAYFSSRLESPLGIIKSFFADQTPWGSTLIKKEQMETFLDSEIFSESYFRGMMGTYMSNVLHIRIESEENQIDWKVGDREVHEDNYHNVDEIVTIEVENNDRIKKNTELSKSRDQEQGTLNNKKNFGVGLFHLYSKLNHSCCCNTVNQGGSEAEVTLIATSDIPMGKYHY